MQMVPTQMQTCLTCLRATSLETCQNKQFGKVRSAILTIVLLLGYQDDLILPHAELALRLSSKVV
jgi:hypothetical protein